MKFPVKLEEMMNGPINVLMFPPRSEDWTKYALRVAREIPQSNVFYGCKTKKTSLAVFSEKLLPSPSKGDFIVNPPTLRGRMNLALREDRDSPRIFPFNYRNCLDILNIFSPDKFDLAITQTPTGTDTMLGILGYRYNNLPQVLSSVLKPQSYWIHMTSSYTLEDESYPYFDLINSDSPENVENPILRSIFGKNGKRLTPKEIQRIRDDHTLGEYISDSNKWMVYSRLEEQRKKNRKL